MEFYPAFLNLEGKKVVVVGGGKVAERKVLSLLGTGAKIIVISPSLTKRLSRERTKGTISHKPRTFRPSDVRAAFLVVSATDSPETGSKVAESSPGLVNVADVPSLCNFIVPSVVKRGALVIAISTGGASPACAKTIRQEIEQNYGPEFAGYLTFVKRIRQKALAELGDNKIRGRFLRELGSAGVLELLRTKGLKHLKQNVLQTYSSIISKKGRKIS